MAQNRDHGFNNLDTTDSARIIVLNNKSANNGLQETEKEELKVLLAKNRLVK